MVAEIIRSKRLKRDCTYPIMAKIKEIRLGLDESESYDPDAETEFKRSYTEYIQILEFDNSGVIHTVKGHTYRDKKLAGNEDDIVELLIDPNNGERFLIKDDPNNDGRLNVITAVTGILWIAASVVMIIVSNNI